MKMSSFARSYLRERAGELMPDTCVITRPGPERVVYDRVTRIATNAPAQVKYEGPCRLWEVPAGQSVAWNDGEMVLSSMYLSLPWDAPVPEPEDQIRITSSDDTSVVGKYVQVISVTRGGSLRASRRLLVQYVDTRDEQW